MDQALVDVFEQARKLVVEADRKIAEEAERFREKERERLLRELGARIEEAFDFTSKEKLELEPRLDVKDGVGVIEFVVRSLRAIFLLLPNESNTWTLQVVEDGHEPQVLSEFRVERSPNRHPAVWRRRVSWRRLATGLKTSRDRR
ncbi:hypothetical protein [Edaphobacter aggregans]|uniref:hypothetical protein n=1 Tax=Edaphobacter aggregans TaxID=570835 RepID=UPI0005589540|nr:hypothetical protein [Edaphobacter aggregans]